MKLIARFIKRGRDGAPDNAAVMAVACPEYFKEDMVYEIVDILGDMVIREAGTTHMDPKKWNHEIQHVMCYEHPLLTAEERKQLNL